MLKVLFTIFPSPPSTLIYQGEGVSVILTQRATAESCSEALARINEISFGVVVSSAELPIEQGGSLA
jgi:hypothetical protein